MKNVFVLPFLLVLSFVSRAQTITKLPADARLIGYEVKLREPEVYQIHITYVTDKGKLDSVTVRGDWSYNFVSMKGNMVGFKINIKPINPKTLKKGLAEFRIIEDLVVKAMGFGYRSDLTHEVGVEIEVPVKEQNPIKSN